MKRIYTKLMQATLSLAMVLLISNMATAQDCDIPAPDGAVWGTQFDGGLDGWTALDGNFEERKDGNGNDIGWEWSADGDVSSGAFDGGVFASDQTMHPSICNGCVLMNSDFLDNEGVPNFGAGLCPAVCSSVLLSPPIDLSEVDGSSFVLQFASQHRHFTSTYSVLISIDDGATWTDTVTVFPDGYIEALTNSPHLYNELERIPLCGLGNEREVRLAILYDANYYYWILDDLYIIAEDKPDLRVNENFTATTVTWGTPADQAFPLAWLTDISNQSPVDSDGGVLTVSVAKNGVDIHSQTLDYGPIAGCGDEQNRNFDMMYTPEPSAGDEYTVTYTIEDNTEDAIMQNNSVSRSFIYTDLDYIKVPSDGNNNDAYRDSRFGADTRFQSFGSAFYVKNGTRDGNQLFVESINFGIESADADADPVADGEVEVTIYEWLDIDNDGDVDAGMEEKLKLATITVFTDQLVEEGINERNITVTPITPDGGMVALKDNTQYIVMTHYNPYNSSDFIHMLYSPTESNRDYDDTAMEFAFEQLAATSGDNISARVGTMGAVDGVTHDDRDNTREFIGVFWGTSLINIGLVEAVGTEDINENIGINVYPNPAQSTVFADIALEEVSETVVVELVDMTGKIALTKSYSNMKNDRISMDIESLVDGMYIMNIRTDEGVNSQKFTVHNVK